MGAMLCWVENQRTVSTTLSKRGPAFWRVVRIFPPQIASVTFRMLALGAEHLGAECRDRREVDIRLGLRLRLGLGHPRGSRQGGQGWRGDRLAADRRATARLGERKGHVLRGRCRGWRRLLRGS